MRWVVGDIQGCMVEFESLLSEIRFDGGKDELWCLGDLINRGPESANVLRLFNEIGGRSVLGNHEIYALAVRSGLCRRQGDTLDKLFRATDAGELFEGMRQWPVLARLPEMSVGRAAWLVHAGVHPGWHDLYRMADDLNNAGRDDAWLLAEEVSFAVNVRCCTADGVRSDFVGIPERCPEGFNPWDGFYEGADLVVHGHWAHRGHHRTGNVIGLDSGCVYGGYLTAWCQEEDRIVQVRGGM